MNVPGAPGAPGVDGGRVAVHEIDTARVLCRLADLGEGGTREFRVGGGEWPLRGFVVRVPGGVRAYVNRCAHMDYPLNYTQHEFLTHDGSMIVCFVHGALFEKDNGYCVAGPCSGQSLAPLPVHIEAGYVLLDDAVDVEALAQRYA